jgi:hypothetical protein
MSGVQRAGYDYMITHVVEHSETYIMRYRADLSAAPRH